MPAKITKTSMLSGVTRTLVIDHYEQDEFDTRLNAWKDGKALIQDAFPNLTDSQREFILTGSSDAEWDEYFSEKDEEISDDAF